MKKDFYRNLGELFLRSACNMCETNFWTITDEHKPQISYLINHINKRRKKDTTKAEA